MILRTGHQLLLPANPWFIAWSLIGALALNMLPFGRTAWMPDFLMLALVFWNVHQPLRVGIGIAFMFGLFMDVHQASLLGQHALSYTVLGFMATMMHRRLLWFTVPEQSIHVLPLFVAAHAVALIIRMINGDSFPVWLLLAPVLEAALWPVVTVLLLAPQRRAPDPDADRPL